MRAILLTSTFPRHRAVASIVASRARLAGLWREAKSFVPENYATSEEERAIIQRHFDARDAAEERDFGAAAAAPLDANTFVADVAPGGINDPAAIDQMAALCPDVVLVFGTGLLRRPLIERFRGRIVNIHLGLSPYYRGAGTNFWPLVNREPEYVGATIHFIDEGIDTGDILRHVRPEIDPGDGPHDIGNRTIAAAAAALVDAADRVVAGTAKAVSQAGKGRLYQRKDFSAGAVETLYRNFATGMIPEYLAQRAERDRAIELVQ